MSKQSEFSPSSSYIDETIYGTHDESRVVMSEKVQTLAGSVYREFEKMIARYDEDVVKTLMPLLVNVLECLDSAYQTNQEHEVELELLREDNEQLVTQYEREKATRKLTEQKLLEAEDFADCERKELTSRLESLDSIVRMLEMKHKNSQEQIFRMEERENDLKKEYAKLHERYDELFKAHVENKERMKMLMNAPGTADRDLRNRFNPINKSVGPVSFGFGNVDNPLGIIDTTESYTAITELETSDPQTSLDAELNATEADDKPVELAADLPQSEESPVAPISKSQTRREQRSGNTLYQELQFNDTNEEEANDYIINSWVHPGEYASSSMGKEVENLIQENYELLQTKNALNVVKDDLIIKVDQLTGEQEILREKISDISGIKDELTARVAELEDEVKELREKVKKNASADGNEDESDVPMSQRKRFTRVEMARVLMERNQYKERFMELQDCVRYSELMRASKNDSSMDKKQKGVIWNFFSNLFSTNEKPQRPLSTPHLRNISGTPTLRHSRTQGDFLESQFASEHRRQEKSEQIRHVKAHVRKEEGRTQAYGWSLPGKSSSTKSSSSGVPVPIFCRPIDEIESGMKLFCAAGVDLSGGRTPDGGNVVGASVFYGKEPTPQEGTMCLADEIASAHSPEIQKIDEQILSTQPSSKRNLSSMMWICCGSNKSAVVVIVHANDASNIIASFCVPDKHILCIASIPGATDNDYKEFTEIPEPNIERQSTASAEEDKPIIGAVQCIQANVTRGEIFECPANVDSGVAAEEVSGKESPPLLSSNIEAEQAQESQETDPQTEEPIQEDVKFTSVTATMWLGTERGNIYVHSALGDYSHCIARIKMNDAIMSIVYCASRCVVALADGTVAVFARLPDGQWDFTKYHLLTLGDPKCAVRCLSSVGSTTWCGYRNKVHIIEPKSLMILHTLEAHPRQESQVRQMAWFGDGVWVSIKLDSALRLYHAHTYQHIADVNIEPYVSKMLGTGKVGFSFVRITALLISAGRLWIGTSNGVVISVPLSDSTTRSDMTGDSILDRAKCWSGVIPYCSMSQAQLSFHGHREAVTFFVSVPSSVSTDHTLVVSGGEGYIDFRIADSEMADSRVGQEAGFDKGHRSYLIVWQII